MIHDTIQPDDAAILRVGSNVGNWVAARLHQIGKPYGVEVVQDPYDAYAPGACSHSLRPLFRLWLTYQLRQQCRRACAVAYVTRIVLQQRYPASKRAFTTSYSSIDLPPHAFAARPRVPQPEQQSFTLVMVGMLKQLYKAPDVLIDAVAQCVRAGLNIRLFIVGDGEHRADLEQRATRHGLHERVRFLGAVPAGQAVRAILDSADLFVLPSRQEGLPRAMIEAMARGLPCIGSTVGGFPELLPPDDMVAPGDAAALAGKIHAVLTDPQRRAAMAARNLERARDYQVEKLRERRIQLYQQVQRSLR
jgi:glycosyltransferase involved in cell wall biosynthesis